MDSQLFLHSGPQVPSYGTPQTQAVLDQFEALTLGPAAPGQPGDTGGAAILTDIA